MDGVELRAIARIKVQGVCPYRMALMKRDIVMA